MRVIINADDFGFSHDVNRAIVELLEGGQITSTTIMANAPAFEDAVHHVARLRHCSFGVHLNITELASLTRHAGFGDYLDPSGCFRGDVRSRRLDAAFRAAVCAEWTAQIERVLAAGVPVSHLDSHHHTHTIPRLFSCLQQVRRRFGIDRVRISRNLYARGGMRRRVLLLGKSLWNGALRHFAGAKTTDRFTDFVDFIELADRLRRLPRTVELMVHPGSSQSARETAILTSDWRAKLPYSVELVSYHAL